MDDVFTSTAAGDSGVALQMHTTYYYSEFIYFLLLGCWINDSVSASNNFS